MSELFDNDVSDPELDFKTNNEYSKNYNVWRRKEELNKLKTKYMGDNSQLDGNTSSSSDDDEDAIEITDQTEKEFFKILSCLKNKDPKIYDENINFFQESSNNKSQTKVAIKPLYLKDYERKLIIEKNGILSDSDEDKNSRRSPTYIEEQNNLKENLKAALEEVNISDEDEWGGMFKARQKTKEEAAIEESDYKAWLAGQNESLIENDITTALKPLKEFWTNPKLDQKEKFLRDYILNKKFLDRENENYIPTYEEIIHDSEDNLSEDENAIERQEEFEHKFNFRFEDPDQDFIKRYPRIMENSVRKTDNRRQVKRVETKERKKKEKAQKFEDLKQLRDLKRKEIEEKIEKLKEMTGNKDITFQEDDVDGDFDPDAHDKRMQTLFNDQYYDGVEDQKPEFRDSDEDLETENWDKWNGATDDADEKLGEPHCEDDNFNMDCDYNPGTSKQNELTENLKKKKRKKKSKFAAVMSKPRPSFDPTNMTYEKYVDEYYKLDCEDIIDDIPCRFKYRQVVPNSFGLSIEEILQAKDRELNKWCSLKKAVQIRPDHVERYEQIAFDKKGQNINLKMKILPSLFSADAVDTEKGSSTKLSMASNIRNGGNYEQNRSQNDDTNSLRPIDVENKPKKYQKLDIEQSNMKEIFQISRVEESNKIIDKPIIFDKNNVLSPNNEDGKDGSNKRKKLKRKHDAANNDFKTENPEHTAQTTVDINKSKFPSTPSIGGTGDGNKQKKLKRKQKRRTDNSKIQKMGTRENCKEEIPKKKLKTDINKSKKNREIDLTDARLSAYGFNPKKFKNKLKYKN